MEECLSRVEQKIDMLIGGIADKSGVLGRGIAAIRAEMATRDDLAAIRSEMAARDDAIRREMATRHDMAALRSDMNAGLERVEAKLNSIAHTQSRINLELSDRVDGHEVRIRRLEER
jgi:hypothetical protein